MALYNGVDTVLAFSTAIIIFTILKELFEEEYCEMSVLHGTAVFKNLTV